MSALQIVSAASAAALFIWFLRPGRRDDTSALVPVLALIVGLLSFWIAEQSDSWPMAVAGLIAYLLALTYLVPRSRVAREAVNWPVRVSVIEDFKAHDAPALTSVPTPVVTPFGPVSRIRR